jgi:Cu2+-exporting ATPase
MAALREGNTQADEALLTGESTPVSARRQPGNGGQLQPAGAGRGEGGGDWGQTRFAQIVALMESASLQKPRLAQLADRIARPFSWLCCWRPGWRLSGGGLLTRATR